MKLNVGPSKIKEDIHEEKEAIKGYQSRKKQSKGKLKGIFSHLLKDEKEHKTKLKEGLKYANK